MPKSQTGTIVRLAGCAIAGALLVLSLLLAPTCCVRAQEPGTANLPPAKVRELVDLLDDPTVRDWLARQRETRPAPPAPAPDRTSRTMADMTAPAMAIRRHVMTSLAAVPTALPELGRTLGALRQEIADRGLWSAILLVGMFVGLGWLLERVYWRATAHFRRRLIAMELDTVEKRLGAVGRRLLFGLGWAASFALGSLGAFLLFDWPPLLHALISRLLLVMVAAWLTTVMLRFLLAPGAERFRILPMPTRSAQHWYLWLAVAVVWYVAGHLLLWFLTGLGLNPAVVVLLQDALSLGWLAILLLAVWMRPGSEPSGEHPTAHLRARNALISCALVAVWLLVPLGSVRAFYTIVTLATLGGLLVITHRSVAHILRPPGFDTAEAVLPFAAVALERGLRVLWIIGAAFVLIDVWEIDVGMMSGDTMLSRLLHGVLHALVILLLAELAWQLTRSWIDRTLTETATQTAVTPEAQHRRARVRTLLPIARNMLLVVLVIMAVLMALSALGVQVGPLIAGAGVVGVAIGFGSQTLVKDIISGIFFLLDDAFRVGEYIESGSIRGTVEGFSLRSIKLRHHRGYLHTVPFGSLEKITNYSRDWVIDKVTLGLTYDTDLDKVKRIIKQIGKELLDDPELRPQIIDTLKMQGVDEYGDFAIKVRLKLTCKPGEQFVIRRRAYGMIKKAFDENGIKFAFPTVQVTGGEAGPAAAQAVLGRLEVPTT